MNRRFEHKTRSNPANHGGGPYQKPGAKYYEPTEQDFLNNRVYQAPGCSKVRLAYRQNYDNIKWSRSANIIVHANERKL